MKGKWVMLGIDRGRVEKSTIHSQPRPTEPFRKIPPGEELKGKKKNIRLSKLEEAERNHVGLNTTTIPIHIPRKMEESKLSGKGNKKKKSVDRGYQKLSSQAIAG